MTGMMGAKNRQLLMADSCSKTYKLKSDNVVWWILVPTNSGIKFRQTKINVNFSETMNNFQPI